MVTTDLLVTCCRLTVLAFAILARGVAAEAVPLPAGAVLIDEDLVGDLHGHNRLVMSPDSRRIAYVSRGALWVAWVDRGHATRLTELPNTLTAALLESAYAATRAGFNRVGTTDRPSGHEPRGPSRGELTTVCGLQWSADQQSVLFMTRDITGEHPHTWVHTLWEVSMAGKRRELARIVRNQGDEPNVFWDFALTPDRRRVVLFTGSYPHTASRHPLFWDLIANRPIVTAYEDLFASPSRRRYLAVDIDTRQWVVLDEELDIAKKLDATLKPQLYPRAAYWSPDEEHAVVVTPLPLPARRKAVVFRFDLKTGEALSACACDKVDRFLLTEQGGEVLQIGRRGIRTIDKSGGVHVSRIVGSTCRRGQLAGFSQGSPRGTRLGQNKAYPMPCVSNDGRRIAIALPRPDGAFGYRYWLVDRRGAKTPLAEDDRALYYSPYRVLAFVDEGRRLLAHDYQRLFTVPIAAPGAGEPVEE